MKAAQNARSATTAGRFVLPPFGPAGRLGGSEPWTRHRSGCRAIDRVALAREYREYLERLHAAEQLAGSVESARRYYRAARRLSAVPVDPMSARVGLTPR